MARDGGLMSYGADARESFDRAAALARSHLPGRQARRSAVRTADAVSARDQHENRQGDKSHRSEHATCDRGRSDRVSAIGPLRLKLRRERPIRSVANEPTRAGPSLSTHQAGSGPFAAQFVAAQQAR